MKLLLLCLSFATIMFKSPISLMAISTYLAISVITNYSLQKWWYKFVLPFVGLYGIYVLNSIFFNSFGENRLLMRLPILVVPLLYGLINVDRDEMYSAIKSYVVGSVSICLIILGRIISYYLEHENVPLSNGSMVTYFTLIHRPYLGYFLAISTSFSMYLFFYRKNWIWLISGFITLLIIVIVGARIALVLAVLSLIFVVFRAITVNRKSVLITLLLFVLMAVGVFLNGNLISRFSALADNEPRTIIWSCAFTELSNRRSVELLTGNGSETLTQNVLNDCYKDEFDKNTHWKWLWENQILFNTHNHYIDLLMTYGLIGLLEFILIIVYLLFVVRKNTLGIVFIVVFSITLLVENLLSRQWGVNSLSFMLPLLIRFGEDDLLTNKNAEK